MSVERELRDLSGAARGPAWEQIEERAAEARMRRHRVRGGVALGAVAVVIGVVWSLDQAPTSTTRTEGPADRPAVTVPDSAPSPSTVPATTVDLYGRTCGPETPIDPSSDPEGDVAALLAEIDSSGVTAIPFPPDCSVAAFVDTEAFTVVAGQGHDDLPVYGIDGEQIGVLVYGIPALTVEEYETDPEGHRQAGRDRIDAMESQLGGPADE